MAASLGAEIVAAGSGVVNSVYEDRYFGNVVVIDHLNSYLTFYGHMARVFHEPGYFVQKGEAIGLVGNTGFSTHPHLHFEVIFQGDNINPAELINR
jgi:murein DD-endopeptidase MepM/ murein hydrolase activator NlpD